MNRYSRPRMTYEEAHRPITPIVWWCVAWSVFALAVLAFS